MSELHFEEWENSIRVVEEKEAEIRDLKGRRTTRTKYKEIARIPKDKEKAKKIMDEILEKIIRPQTKAGPTSKSIRQKMDEAYDR